MPPNDKIFSHAKELHAWNLFNTSTLQQSYFSGFYLLCHLIRAEGENISFGMVYAGKLILVP
jgi:hypothetical protein